MTKNKMLPIPVGIAIAGIALAAIAAYFFGVWETACAPYAGKVPSRPWAKDGLRGLNIELVHPTRYEMMSFGDSGYVGMSIGQKGGPITGPAFKWTIESGTLHITVDGKQRYDDLTLVSQSAEEIVVQRCSGQIATYKVLK